MAIKIKFSVIVLFTICFLKQVKSNLLPNTLCKDTSPECLRATLQSVMPNFVKAYPEIGMPSLDPFVIDKLELTLPGNLKIEFSRGTSKGYRNCVIDSAKMIEDPVERLNNTIDLQMHCNLTIKGLYKSSGSLLMFAINGDGVATIKIRDIKMQFIAKLGSVIQPEDGLKHLKIKKFKSNHSFDGQVYYRMTNLIKGNPALGDLVVEFMNRNWKLVAEEFGKPIVDFGITSILKNVLMLFRAVPQEELIGTPQGFHV